MTNRFLMSVAAVALIAGSPIANAQTGGGSAGGAAAQTSPSTGGSMGSERGSPSAAPMNRNESSEPRGAGSGMKSTQSDEKMVPGSKNQRAQESTPGQKSGNTASDSRDKAGKDMKAEDNGNAADRNNRNADSKTGDKTGDRDSNRAAGNDRDRSSATTGQAGAGAKLSTEQRTKITTVIKSQRIEPTTNVNFSISVGTRVPRDVRFHPLPAEIVTVYPDWRGYDFILVNDQIIVINPRSLEIVAVIDA
jgi:hypothetical protein